MASVSPLYKLIVLEDLKHCIQSSIVNCTQNYYNYIYIYIYNILYYIYIIVYYTIL